MTSQSRSRLSLPVILLAMLVTAVCCCGISGAIFSTVAIAPTRQYQQPAVETFGVNLVFCGGLGFILAIPAMVIIAVLHSVRNRRAPASAGAEADHADPPTPPGSAGNSATVMAALAALAGSIVCGLAAPVSVYLAQEPIRSEGELEKALIRSAAAFLIAAPLGAAVAGMLAWVAVQIISRTSQRE